MAVEGDGAVTSSIVHLRAALRSCGASGHILQIVVPAQDEEVLRSFFERWREPGMPQHIISRPDGVAIVAKRT
jgi:hypothetical protein